MLSVGVYWAMVLKGVNVYSVRMVLKEANY